MFFQLFENLLKLHADKPFVFILASRCAKDDLRSLSKSRDYLFQGIRAHPGNVDLYREAFLLEFSLAKAKYEELLAESAKVKKEEEGEPKVSNRFCRDSHNFVLSMQNINIPRWRIVLCPGAGKYRYEQIEGKHYSGLRGSFSESGFGRAHDRILPPRPPGAVR